MSDIVKFSPAANGVGFAAGAAAFQQAKPQTKGGGVALLKLRRTDGRWCFGKDDIEVEDGAELVVDANATAIGFVDWKGGRPVGEHMAVVGQDTVNAADLPPAQGPNGWEDQVALGMTVLNGEDEGEMVLYKTNNQGGIEAFNTLFDAMTARAAAGKSFNPVITLASTSYTHPEYGKIYKPVFEVTRWMGSEVEAVEDQTEEEETPKRRRRRS